MEVPGHFLSGSTANIPGLIAGETEKSRNSAKAMLAAFDAAANKAGILHETQLEKCPTFAVPDVLVDHARLRDLTIVPVPESYDQWYAEAMIFGSGRPILVLPESARARPFELGTVAIAWDFSRAAARAVSDAMPLLEKARKVRIVTVTNEKKLDSKHSAEALARNLARHGIDVMLDKVDANGRRIVRCSKPTLFRTTSTFSRRPGAPMGTRGGASSSSAAPPRVRCQSHRSRSCFRIDGRLAGIDPRRAASGRSGSKRQSDVADVVLDRV